MFRAVNLYIRVIWPKEQHGLGQIELRGLFIYQILLFTRATPGTPASAFKKNIYC